MTIILEPLENALESLKKAVERSKLEPEDDMIRDAVIQRFEYTFELCWKLMKRQLEKDSPNAEEVGVFSYKDLCRQAGKASIIEDVAKWFVFREKRNLTSHIYNQSTALDVYQSAVEFQVEAEKLLSELKRRKNDSP